MHRSITAGIALNLLLFGTASGGPFEDGGAAYRSGDFAAAYAAWIPLAEAGDPIAQLDIGILYDQGHGIGKDAAEAARWYRLAADQGSSAGAFNLGLMYEVGEGVDQDIETALNWYRIAGEAGDVVAQFKLGSYYENGTHVAQDHSEAHKWYMLSAKHKHPASMFRLASLYTNGLGVKRSLSQANKWNELADEAQMSSTTSAACNQRSRVVQEACRRTTPRL